MSQENVEIVRSIYEAWERADFSTADWAHPDIEYVVADGPDQGSWTGQTEMAEAFGDSLSAWEGFRVLAEEVRALDDERVLVLYHFDARGKRSGLETGQISTKGAQLFHVRDGKVTRFVQYPRRDDALEDLGLGQ